MSQATTLNGMAPLTAQSVTIAVMSHNRGAYLRHAVESIWRHAPHSRLLIVDDDSDDPETRDYLQEVAEKAEVILNLSKRQKKRGAYLGGLYDNMNIAVARSAAQGVPYIFIMQDDQQLLRALDTEFFAGVERIFAADPTVCQVQPLFFKGFVPHDELERRFCWNADLGFYRERTPSYGICDIGIIAVQRLTSRGFTFVQGEGNNARRALDLGLTMVQYRDPVLMYMPWPRTDRDTPAMTARYALGPHAFRPMGEEACRRLLARPIEHFPLAEDYLDVDERLSRPWWYTSMVPHNRLEYRQFLDRLRRAGEERRILDQPAPRPASILLLGDLGMSTEQIATLIRWFVDKEAEAECFLAVWPEWDRRKETVLARCGLPVVAVRSNDDLQLFSRLYCPVDSTQRLRVPPGVDPTKLPDKEVFAITVA